MNIKIKLRTLQELKDLQNIFKKMLQLNSLYIDYIEYYNSLNLLKKINDTIFKKSISPGKINISIELNQFNTLNKIVNLSENFIFADVNILYRIIILDILEQGRKQVEFIELQHKLINL